MSSRFVYVFIVGIFFSEIAKESFASVVPAVDSAPPAVSIEAELVSAYRYLPAPIWTYSTEIDLILSDSPINVSQSSITYRTSDSGTIEYTIFDKEVTGWSDSAVRESIITMISQEAKISPNSMFVSRSSTLPDKRTNLKKLGFAITESVYDTLRESHTEVRFIYRSGIPDDLSPLAGHVFPKSNDESLILIGQIMKSVMEKLRLLSDFGLAHGGLNVEKLYASLDNNKAISGSSVEIFFTDFSKANLSDDNSLVRDWVSVVAIFGALVRKAGISINSTTRSSIAEQVAALVESLRSSVGGGSSVADFEKLVSESIDSFSDLIRGQLVDDGRPTKSPLGR